MLPDLLVLPDLLDPLEEPVLPDLKEILVILEEPVLPDLPVLLDPSDLRDLSDPSASLGL